MDTQYRYLRNVNVGQVTPSTVRWISSVLILEEELLANGKILLIIDASKQYYCYTQCFTVEQAVRLPEHKS